MSVHTDMNERECNESPEMALPTSAQSSNVQTEHDEDLCARIGQTQTENCAKIEKRCQALKNKVQSNFTRSHEAMTNVQSGCEARLKALERRVGLKLDKMQNVSKANKGQVNGKKELSSSSLESATVVQHVADDMEVDTEPSTDVSAQMFRWESLDPLENVDISYSFIQTSAFFLVLVILAFFGWPIGLFAVCKARVEEALQPIGSFLLRLPLLIFRKLLGCWRFASAALSEKNDNDSDTDLVWFDAPDCSDSESQTTDSDDSMFVTADAGDSEEDMETFNKELCINAGSHEAGEVSTQMFRCESLDPMENVDTSYSFIQTLVFYLVLVILAFFGWPIGLFAVCKVCVEEALQRIGSFVMRLPLLIFRKLLGCWRLDSAALSEKNDNENDTDSVLFDAFDYIDLESQTTDSDVSISVAEDSEGRSALDKQFTILQNQVKADEIQINESYKQIQITQGQTLGRLAALERIVARFQAKKNQYDCDDWLEAEDLLFLFGGEECGSQESDKNPPEKQDSTPASEEIQKTSSRSTETEECRGSRSKKRVRWSDLEEEQVPRNRSNPFWAFLVFYMALPVVFGSADVAERRFKLLPILKVALYLLFFALCFYVGLGYSAYVQAGTSHSFLRFLWIEISRFVGC